MVSFREKLAKATMESVGTFMLLFTIQVSVGQGGAGIEAPIAIGVVLITLVYAGGPISGANYNPSVSLAIFLRAKMDLSNMLTYWAAQMAGGYLGALCGGIIGGTYSNISAGDDSNLVQVVLAEVVFTFLLCLVVLAVATNSKVDGNHYYGAAIGLVVTAGAITVGPISGGAFNPAVALGLCLAKGFDNLPYAITVTLADLVGGALAAGVFYIVAPDQFEVIEATAGEATVGEVAPAGEVALAPAGEVARLV